MVGGGLSSSHIGELAMGRAAVLLNAEGIEIELVPIDYHPDEAGLIGAAASRAGLGVRRPRRHPRGRHRRHQPPRRRRQAQTSKKTPTSPRPRCGSSSTGATRDDKPTREEAVERIAAHAERADRADGRARRAQARAVRRHRLPRHHRRATASIQRGGQNLPGNWESSRFNLPAELRRAPAARSTATRPWW